LVPGRASDLYQLAASMRPTMSKPDVRANPIRCDQAIISSISIYLKDARKALQYPLGM
jgi:hypothetical protein